MANKEKEIFSIYAKHFDNEEETKKMTQTYVDCLKKFQELGVSNPLTRERAVDPLNKLLETLAKFDIEKTAEIK